MGDLILSMKKIDLLALIEDRKEILEYLQLKGIVEITDIKEDLGLDNERKQDTISIIDRNMNIVDKAIGILSEKIKFKKPLFSCRDEIDKTEYDKKLENISKYIQISSEILSMSQKISDKLSMINKCEIEIGALSIYKSLDVPMNFPGTKKTKMVLINLPSEIDSIYKIENMPKEVYEERLEKIEDKNFFVLICHVDVYEEAINVLRNYNFSIISTGLSEIEPGEKINELENKIEESKKEIKKLNDSIIEFEKDMKNIKFAYDYLSMRKEKYERIEKLRFTDKTFLATAYIEEELVDDFIKDMEERFDIHIEVYDIPEEEDYPIKFKNNGFVKPVESVTELYSMPSRNDIDPNAIMAPFYYLMFGLMLSDAVYGLILSLGCLFIQKKFKLEEKTKNQMKMFTYCGISTVFWGILFGSYFGNGIDVISKLFFGKEVTVSPLWFSPLDNAMKMLIFSFALGFFHVLVGMIVDFYIKCKNKNIIDGISDDLSWWGIFAGLSMISISYMFEVKLLLNIGIGLCIIGVLAILITSGIKEKGIGKITAGLGKLYGITGYLSDVLSYSRLLALGLATGVVASVINTMGSMAGNSVIGLIVFIIVFVLGHAMNIGINVLGAYVHTGRLQYVEFFSKFYQGGGKAFKPFSTDNNKYYKIKEDN